MLPGMVMAPYFFLIWCGKYLAIVYLDFQWHKQHYVKFCQLPLTILDFSKGFKSNLVPLENRKKVLSARDQ